MPTRTAGRVSPIALCAVALVIHSGCGGSPTSATPVPKTETFTGTLQPMGIDSQNFNITYTQGTSDLSITINSLTTSAGSPVTGITIGVGFGTLSGSACVLQITAPAATLGQELFAPNGASAGSYCAQIFDCPSGATGCTPTLPEPVTYSMTVKHY